MKFSRNSFKTALCLAVENDNIEIVKLLFLNDKFDKTVFAHTYS